MAGTVASNVPNLSGAVSSVTETGGAATLNAQAGVVTSAALTTAQNANYTLTLTNSYVGADSVVLCSVKDGTNSQGTTVVTKVTPAAGSVVFIIANKHSSAEALNGTIKVSFVVL